MPSRPTISTAPARARGTRILLLWMALLLALAQVLAVRHAYTHPLESTGSVPAKHSGGLAHCDLCIVAAGIGSAAPPAALPLFFAAAAFVAFAARCTQQHSAPFDRPYAIRAPPAIAC